MPLKNENLHGSAPDTCDVALLLIDVINALDFEGSEDIVKAAIPVADHILELKRRAEAAHVPVIYANDNFGRWQSDFQRIIDHCLEDGIPGKPIVEKLQPDERDYFVLKPKHSSFFSTTLDTLLEYLQVKTLILAGFAGNICVLFTANDAYMRDFNILVPSDCMASNSKEENDHALQQMQIVLKADIRPSTEIDFDELLEASTC